VVAALSFTIWVPLSKVGLLLLVILFHELGHLWAMRTFGYTDTSLFFVPFFGGAAAGQKTDATAAERVIVALMGPLPGLLLAIVLAAIYPMFGAPPLLWDTIWMLFLINLFNLAPLLPLDGGHVINHLLVARWSGAETLLRGLGVMSFLALGALDPIFLVVAAFGILSWRSQSRLSQMSRALSAELFGADEPRLRMRALAWLYAHGGDRATFAQRLALVKGVELRGSVGAMTPRMAWTLGGIYLSLLIGAPLALRALV